MTPYATLISTATGTTDPATVALIELFMRINRSGLDDLDKRQFNRMAREAHHDILALHHEGVLVEICEGYDVAVPAIR
jgi:hypothetical protein